MMRRLAGLALLFCLAQPAFAAERAVLPAGAAPDRYEIEVVPDARSLTFAGKVTIALRLERPSPRIVLNAADLEIDSALLDGRVEGPRVELDPRAQTAAFVFATPLPAGPHRLTIAYRGRINRSAAGLFALDYATPQGERRALFTQFENADARRFVPCWDEPAAKAVFALTVVAPKGQMAVSNMPVASVTSRPGGRQAVRFQDSPRMSSYLAFLAVGDFERVARKVDGVDVGVVVRRGDAARARYALDAAARLLPYFNAYFATPYPLPKLDLVAGPGRSQFFGAMENWGAIFVFDYALLSDPATSTDADRQGIFSTIAHELAHQWFGDLVTMAWWDDLWLNEGFASWMEDKATAHFHPQWRVELQGLRGRERAMRLDARAGTHPVITPIPDVIAASNAFDAITYQKGQAVIRMLEVHMGEEAFRAGVRRYIASHAYGSTTTDDLWRSLDEVAPRPVTGIAHDFTLQAGVPLVRATRNAGGLRLDQARFGVDGASRSAQAWRTPVVVQPASAAAPVRLLLEGTAQVPVAGEGAVVNAGQAGYFRTAYAPELWRGLLQRLPSLPAIDQLGLIYDSLALGEVGEVPLSDILELADRLPVDADPVVSRALAAQLMAIDDLYEGNPGQAAFRAYARARLQPLRQRLGWTPRPGEAENDAVLRIDVLIALGKIGDPEVLAEARSRFDRMRADPRSQSASQRRIVLAIVARRADERTWAQLRAMARAERDPTERARLYGLLGAAEADALADRALALALTDEPPVTARPEIIGAVAQNFPERAFDFVLANRAALDAALEPASRTGFLTSLPQASRQPGTADRLLDFARRELPPSAYPEAEKSASAIRFRAEVAANRLGVLDRWLAAR